MTPFENQQRIKNQILGSYNQPATIQKSEDQSSITDGTKEEAPASVNKENKEEEGEGGSSEEEGNRFSKSETEALNEMIQKGEISDTLASGYGAGSQPLVFNKTGKEIKEKIPNILAILEAQKLSLEGQLTVLQEQSGIVPANKNTRKYDKNVPFLRYDYKQTEPEYLGNNQYSPKTDQMDVCNKYNALVWVYNDVLDDIDAIKVISSNVEDSKKYNLSVSQLVSLGFK